LRVWYITCSFDGDSICVTALHRIDSNEFSIAQVRCRGSVRVERSFTRILFVPLIVAIGIFLIVHFNLHSFFVDRERLSELLTSYGPLSVVIFIALQIVQVVVSPLPGDVTGLIGGYLYGAFLGTVYSTIGLTVGSWLAFLLARSLGMPFVEKVIRPATIRKYDHFIEHQGRAISFVFFLIPGFPKDTLCYILGLSHMRTRDFIVISTAGRLLGTIILSLQGSSLREDQDVIFFILLGVTAVIIVGGYFHVGWRLKSLMKKKKDLSGPAHPPQQQDPDRVSDSTESGANGKKG
jgi:uncharacterized membrane protein YdjX (TVP38/TMEM64 family)